MVGVSPRHYAADTALKHPSLEQRRRARQGARPVAPRAFFYGDLLSLLPGPEPFWFFAMPPILWAVLWLLLGRLVILPWR